MILIPSTTVQIQVVWIPVLVYLLYCTVLYCTFDRLDTSHPDTHWHSLTRSITTLHTLTRPVTQHTVHFLTRFITQYTVHFLTRPITTWYSWHLPKPTDTFYHDWYVSLWWHDQTLDHTLTHPIKYCHTVVYPNAIIFYYFSWSGVMNTCRNLEHIFQFQFTWSFGILILY